MEQQSKKWYVVRAVSGKEKKAKEYIESEMAKRGWSEDVPQVLVPTEKVVSIRNGKKVVKDRNYLPGYVRSSLLSRMFPMYWTSCASPTAASLSPCVSMR